MSGWTASTASASYSCRTLIPASDARRVSKAPLGVSQARPGGHFLAQLDAVHLLEDVLELVAHELEVVLREPQRDLGPHPSRLVAVDGGLRPGASIGEGADVHADA